MANYLANYLFNKDRTEVNKENVRSLIYNMDSVETEIDEVFIERAISLVSATNLSSEMALVQNHVKEFTLELLNMHVPTMEGGWNKFLENPEIFNIMLQIFVADLTVEAQKFDGDLFIEADQLSTYNILMDDTMSPENVKRIICDMFGYDLDVIFGSAEGNLFLRNFFSTLTPKLTEEFILEVKTIFIIPIVNVLQPAYTTLKYIEDQPCEINLESIDVQDVTDTIDVTEGIIEELEYVPVQGSEHMEKVEQSITQYTATISYLYSLLAAVARTHV